MLATWGSELEILRRATIEELAKNFGPMIAEGIRRVRMGEVSLNPGFDGQYGRVSIFTKKEKS